jgi:glutathione S-transferase
MKLYYAPKTRAGRVRWMLEELGVPYELQRVDLKSGEHKKAAYLDIHPHGVVPALSDGDTTLFESAAIILHLADRFPDRGLAPAPGTPERARYYQWIIYGMATLEPLIVRAATPVEKSSPASIDEAKTKFAECARVLERELTGRDYLLGTFSAADIVIGGNLIWSGFLGLLKGYPALEAYCKRLGERDASRRARAD